MSAPTLYWFPISPFARFVRYFLLAAEIEHEAKEINLMKGEQKTDAYKAVNPHQKVPALVHGDLSIFESNAIVRYLANLFESDLLPYKNGAAAVAGIDQHLDYINNSLAKAINTLNYEKTFKSLLGQDSPDADIVAKNESDLKGLWATVNDTYFKEDPKFALGSGLTAVDLLLSMYVAQAQLYGFDYTEYPALAAFFENIKETKTFQAAHAEFFALVSSFPKK